jgi:hypothetical protein
LFYQKLQKYCIYTYFQISPMVFLNHFIRNFN